MITQVEYRINGGPPIAVSTEEVIQLRPDDSFEVTEATIVVSSQVGCLEGNGSLEGYVRKLPERLEDFDPEDFAYDDGRFNSAAGTGTLCSGTMQYPGLVRGPTPETTASWMLQAGWDRFVLVLIQNFEDGTTQVLARFFLNLQVGQPDFCVERGFGADPICVEPGVLPQAAFNPIISPSSPAVDDVVTISGGWCNVGIGRYRTYTEVDVFKLGDESSPADTPVWVGALSGIVGPGECVEGDYVNDPLNDPFTTQWMPEEPGTYLVVFFAEAERFWIESNESNNSLVVGVEVGNPNDTYMINRDVLNFEQLVAELKAHRPFLGIHGSIRTRALDGLEQSFRTTGRSWNDGIDSNDDGFCDDSDGDRFCDDYGDFRALVAFGRVFTFDFATGVIARAIQATVAETEDDRQALLTSVRHMLEVYQGYIELHSAEIDDEGIVDFLNTIQDSTPFNVSEEASLIHGVTGNLASAVQAFLAFQLITRQLGDEDTSFEPFARRLLNELLQRQVMSSPFNGLFLSRPSEFFESGTNSCDPTKPAPQRFAIIENNLRVFDTLGLAQAVIGDQSLRAPFAALRNALRHEFLDHDPPDYQEAVTTATGANIDDEGRVLNGFNSQDLYTIGGVFLLREAEAALRLGDIATAQAISTKVRQIINFLDEHFLVRHRSSDTAGSHISIRDDSAPSASSFPDAGVQFFISNDMGGDLTCAPINFDLTDKIGHQTEATLDYMILVHEYGVAVPDQAEKNYASARYDFMGQSLVQLYNAFSDVGLLPASSRRIFDLFTQFDATLPTNEAILVDLIRHGGDPNHLYRGFRPTPADADLSITKSDSPDPVIAGTELTYTVTVRNDGPSDASGVIVTDTLPSKVKFRETTVDQGACAHSGQKKGGTVICDVGNLSLGGDVVITIVVKAPKTKGIITNTATAIGGQADPDSTNNTDSEQTSVRRPARIRHALMPLKTDRTAESGRRLHDNGHHQRRIDVNVIDWLLTSGEAIGSSGRKLKLSDLID